MDGGTSIGSTLHRFSVHDYHRMAEAGLFAIGARVELIRGAVLDMQTIGSPHLWTVNRLTMLLAPLVAGRAIVSVQNSVRLDDYSEPEPDLVLISPGADQSTHPGPPDILLVIEVADTTLGYDRSVKTPLYAEARLPEYWIVNLTDRVIEVHRDPHDGAYRTVRRVAAGLLSIEALPGLAVAAAAILPSSGPESADLARPIGP